MLAVKVIQVLLLPDSLNLSCLGKSKAGQEEVVQPRPDFDKGETE